MIDHLFQLRKQVFAGLGLTAEIIETQGRDLDVGEKFKVKFTVTHNLYDPATGWYEGNVRFVDCCLHLEATEHARPVVGSPLDLSLGTLTYVGQTVEKNIEFEALSRLSDMSIGVDYSSITASVYSTPS